MKKNYFLILLSISICAGSYAQKNTSSKVKPNSSLQAVASKHKQIYDNSCIPMSIEMVLKFNNAVAPGFYTLQNQWKNKVDGTFRNFDGKTISGLKFKHQFDVERGDNFPFDRLFKTIDQELAAGRKVIISLPSGYNFWHMYVIDKKTDRNEYVAYSRFYNDQNLIVKKDVKSWVFGAKGTDILTYQIAD